MKRVLFIIALFISFVTAAQYQMQPYSNSSTLFYGRGLFGSDSGYVHRYAYADTTAANRGYIDLIPGAIIRTTGGFLWMRNDAATAWVLIGGASGSGTNIYNSDGTLSGDRVVNLNSNTLTFNNSGSFIVYDGVAASPRLKITDQFSEFASPDITNQFKVYNDSVTLVGEVFHIGSPGSSKGVLSLAGNTSGRITIQPAAAAGTYTLTLPTSDGTASQFLQTDGSGVLTWATVSGGSAANADTIVYLSQSGVVSDADISEGSTTFGTDNTAAIQAVLDLAATKSLKVIWDVRASVTGLKIDGNTWIEALPGMGAILRNSSNKALFSNKDTAFGREPVDSNIIITGGIWNGNAYNSGLTPAQAKGTAANGLTNVFSFYGVRNLIVRDFVILRQRIYAIHGINIRNGLYENGVIDCGTGGGSNSDGVHFDGYSENCAVRKMKIKAEDDAVAINADDIFRSTLYGDGTVLGYFPVNAGGPVYNIEVSDIYLDDGLYGVRVLSGGSRVDNIRVSNITGITETYAFIIDNYWRYPDSLTIPGPGNIGSISIDNLNVGVHGGGADASNLYVRANIENLLLTNFKRYGFANASAPTILIEGASTEINNFSLDGYDSYDTTTAGAVHITNDGLIKKMSISRASIRRKSGAEIGELLRNSETIGSLLFNGVSADTLRHILNNTSTISSINAVNIYHNSPNNYASFLTTTTIPSLVLSNYKGQTKTSGTFTATSGDAYSVTSVTATDGNGFDFTVTNPTTTPTITATTTLGLRQVMVAGASGDITGTESLKFNGNQLDISGATNPGFRIYVSGSYGWYFYNGAGAAGNFGMFDITAAKDRFIIHANGDVKFGDNAASTYTFNHTASNGRTFLGGAFSAGAILELNAGTATVPPFKFNSGTDLTTGQVGAMEFGSSRLAFTPSGTTRKRILLSNDVTPSNGQIPVGNGTDFTVANITSTGGSITVTNGAGTINIETAKTLAEGTYTPTLTNTTNISASTAFVTNYYRVGDRIYVFGAVNVTATAAGAIELRISLPVTSTFTNTYDGAGTAFCGETGVGAAISINVAGTIAAMKGITTGTTDDKYYFHFSYKYTAP